MRYAPSHENLDSHAATGLEPDNAMARYRHVELRQVNEALFFFNCTIYFVHIKTCRILVVFPNSVSSLYGTLYTAS